MATGRCGCGCASVELEVNDTAPRAYFNQRVPVSAHGRDGQALMELLLFVDDGMLSLLEIVWYDDPINTFPPVAAFEPPTCDNRTMAEVFKEQAEQEREL